MVYTSKNENNRLNKFYWSDYQYIKVYVRFIFIFYLTDVYILLYVCCKQKGNNY